MVSAKTTARLAGGAAESVVGRSRLAVRVVWVVGLACLTMASAQVRIPIGTVPITLQTLAVLLTGFLLRPHEAAAAMALYVGAGLAGLPVFAAAHTGCTGGYLVGFLLAAPLVSVVSCGHQGRIGRLVLAALAGAAVIYACGVTWLAVVLNSVSSALRIGCYPFLPGAALKIALAVSAVRASRALYRPRRAMDD